METETIETCMKHYTVSLLIILLLLACGLGILRFSVIPAWNTQHLAQKDTVPFASKPQASSFPSTQAPATPSSTLSQAKKVFDLLSSRQRITQLYIFSLQGSEKNSATKSAKIQWIVANNPGVINTIFPAEKADQASASAENIKQQISLVSPVTPLFYTNGVFPNDFTPVAVKTANGAMNALLSGNMLLLIKSDRTLPSVEKMTNDLVQLYETTPDLKAVIDKNVLRLLQQKANH